MTFEDRCKKAVDRVSGKVGMEPILDLGMMPHADGLLTADQLAAIKAGKKKENKWPLELGFAQESTLVQITETVDPTILFGADYPYFSSFSDAWLKHCRENALNLIKTRNLNSSSFVVELASNDGYMLKNFVEAGIPVQGIDPAPGPAAAATKIGVPTVCDFFMLEMARKMAREGKKADVVIGNNVMAHVADTNGFVQGIREILKDDGTPYQVFTPYSRRWLANFELAPPTVMHELPRGQFLATASEEDTTPESLGFVRYGGAFPRPEFPLSVIEHYDETRDLPALPGTSRLGVHLRFGTVSIRRLALAAYELNRKFLGELIWREF